jgi:2-succinyl-6-hydroxy-2,4-cyclohexadiene-1-carboxylate synthase
MAESVVLLHGFGGTRRGWEAVIAQMNGEERYRPQALDLPGHGAAGSLRPITFPACVAHVLASSPPSFALAGYSMGGRVALQVALAAPERVLRLVLIATTAGIADEGERARRRVAEARLADELESVPYEEFIARWRGQPLFAGDPPWVAEAARADQRRNDPANLAVALRGIGTGEMAPLWERLPGLAMPTAVVVGERDAKFRALGERMADRLPRGELVVLAGGHALPLENPSALAGLLSGGSL